ncbi:MAG: GNAT family N-acetyltransferase [Lachnospiraceae bacterium]|nr:GNAT family N-acetyltransferase [Lachnospiraceae bacterium]
MKLETERLILRRFEESDAEDVFAYAKDPDVGPIAGWPPHQSVEESLDVIRNVLNGPEAYAICLKSDERAIGAIELKLKERTDFTERKDECELGYWLGKPFWGQGIMPEAAREMLRYAFEDLGMRKVWCGYYDGNTKSRRVQEKVGFRYQWTTPDVDVPLMKEKRIGHVNALTREEWKERAE